jgi:hypothetical protein
MVDLAHGFGGVPLQVFHESLFRTFYWSLVVIIHQSHWLHTPSYMPVFFPRLIEHVAPRLPPSPPTLCADKLLNSNGHLRQADDGRIGWIWSPCTSPTPSSLVMANRGAPSLALRALTTDVTSPSPGVGPAPLTYFKKKESIHECSLVILFLETL